MTELKSSLPHITLIATAEIKKKEFDDKLTNVISSFDKRFETWFKMSEKTYERGEVKAVKAYETFIDESTIIAQHIYDYFVEDDEQIDDATVNQMADQIKEVINEPPPNTDPAPNNEPPKEPVEPVAPKEPIQNVDPPPVDTTVSPTPPVTDPPPVEEKEEFSSKNEEVLARLYKQGKLTEISKKLLKEEGFDTSWWGNLESTGQKCGKYALSKRTTEEFYNLTKIG